MTDSQPERRRSHRNLSILSVRCRVGHGYSPQVWLTDLSAEGCHLVIRAGTLKPEQRVVIKAQGIEGLPAVVIWVVGTRAGVEFDRPLHHAVVDHLLNAPIPPRSETDKPLVDRFGRPVPELPLGSRRSSTGGRRSCL